MKPESLVSKETIDWWIDLASKTPLGDFVEVGVYRGGSAYRLMELARVQSRNLYLYDTFSGIPYSDEIDSHQVGDFGDTGIYQVMQSIPDAIFRQGIFPETWIERPVAFAHIDCDQYRSVKACCETIWPHVVKGGVMVFDDAPCLAGAKKAVEESFDVVLGTDKWYVVKERV